MRILCALLRAAACAAQAAFYVAPDGDDQAAGTVGAPFATLARAQRAERAAIAAGLREPLTVNLRAGTYDLAETLTFTPADSGTAACPVTWRAMPGETVTLRGARRVAGWTPYRHGIWQADLQAQGLAGVRFWQLFHNGRRQEPARFPNRDPQHPRTGGWLYAEDVGPNPRGDVIWEEGAVPADLLAESPQAELVATYGLGWSTAITPIVKVDPVLRMLSVRPVRISFYPHNRFYLRGALAFLDAEGEWFHDRRAGVLYYRPETGGPPAGEVTVPVLDDVLAVTGRIAYPHGYLNVAWQGTKTEFKLPAGLPPDAPVEWLTFQGLRVEQAEQSGFRLTGLRHGAVLGCRVTNTGSVGINLGGMVNRYEEVGNPRRVPATGEAMGVGGAGQDLWAHDPCQECRVAGCDVWSCGADGIFLYGTGNLAENNHVWDTGLYDKDCAGIDLFGEQNVARRNTIHDLPRNAIFLKGTDNIAELNDLRYTVLETCDGGAIRMCQRNTALRGNVIRWNRILDAPGYGYPRDSRQYQSPYFTWGIYLDDYTCGTTVRGNLISRTGRGGVHVHGGSDNLLEGNVIADAGGYPVECNPIRDDMTGNRVQGNVLVSSTGDRLVYRIGRWVEAEVRFERNLLWSPAGPPQAFAPPGGLLPIADGWAKLGLDTGSVVADPQFADAAHDDYALAPDSPAWRLGFAKLPAEIGCFAAPERAEWPLRCEVEPVREEPLLHLSPPRPVAEDFELDTAGRPPRHGDVSAKLPGRIVVTNATAASGKQSLGFVDGPGQTYRWEPRIFYPLDLRNGTVLLRLALRLDGKQPPAILIDPRDYSAGGEYASGPALAIDRNGGLTAARKPLATLAMDTWVTLELAIPLGAGSPPQSRLTVTPAGGPPQVLTAPHVSRDFHALTRLVILSDGEEPAAFWVDDLSVATVAP